MVPRKKQPRKKPPRKRKRKHGNNMAGAIGEEEDDNIAVQLLDFDSCTIKMKLNSITTDAGMLQLIESLVEKITYAMHYSSIFMNIFVRQFLHASERFDTNVSLTMMHVHSLSAILKCRAKVCNLDYAEGFRNHIQQIKLNLL